MVSRRKVMSTSSESSFLKPKNPLVLQDARKSILLNSQISLEKPKPEEGFIQEDLQRVPKTEKPKKVIILDDSSISSIDMNDSSFLDKPDSKLSINTIKFIHSEFSKPVSARNYEGLEKRFAKLPFFTKYSKTIQRMFLETAELITYKAGEVIIKQGDLGECMFIILSGSVIIYRKAAEYRDFNIIVNSLYDGEAFGELALLSNPKESDIRRTASCVAGETTTVISISKENYRHIILDKMHSDILKRIEFIRNLRFFQNQPWISLIPFVSSLESKTFAVGEVILEQGEIPEGMYIIYSGRCKIYWEGYISKPSSSHRVIIKKPFCTGNYTPFITSSRPSSVKFNENVNKAFYKKFKSEQCTLEKIKAAKYMNTNVRYVNNAVKQRIDYDAIKEGDFFAGRAIMERDYIEPSKFTIVSESKEVKVFIVAKRNLIYLGEDFYQELCEAIEKSDDFDCPKKLEVNNLHNTFTQWQSYKSELISTLKTKSESLQTFRK